MAPWLLWVGEMVIFLEVANLALRLVASRAPYSQGVALGEAMSGPTMRVW